MIDPLPGDIFRKGQVLNNTYEIEGVLGRGGTGEVYRARNQITGRVVAVKALNRAFSSNDAYLELIKREEEMRNLLHDAVVRYTDCSRTDQGHVYLVMDYVDGTSLADLLERGGADPRDLLVVAHRVAEGLVATHARHIVHRDLSPDNIILRGGEPEQAVIIDFGIAKDASAGARTIVGNDFAGKYEYAAPEQLHGRAEARSDLYALGAALLATFRGRVPDVGGSPGAVIATKEKPLDTEGVPEPLKTLIDDLTQPDPARRPPSAAATVEEIGRLLKPRSAAPAPPTRRSRRLWPLLVPVLAVGAGAAAWFLGLRDVILPERLPVAEPYTILVERQVTGEVTLSGHAPDAAGRSMLLESVAEAAGSSPGPEAIRLADGAPVEQWAGAAASMIASAAPLDTWRVELTDEAAALSGVAPDRPTRDSVASAFEEVATAAGFSPRTDVAAGPARLGPEAVARLLEPHETCGPLVPTAPEGGNYSLGATVPVTGSVAERGDIEAARAAISPAIGDRSLRLDLAVLNPALCTVLEALPDAGEGQISIALGYGGEDGPNLSGIYSVGDNPVIDVLLPAGLDTGYLWVAVADVTGHLFNLLPNVNRREHAVAELGEVENGMRRIRVAYTLAEAAEDPSLPAFEVDDTFGKSLVIVMHTDERLFGELRPTKESVEGFAEALAEAREAGSAEILSMSTQFIDSRR